MSATSKIFCTSSAWLVFFFFFVFAHYLAIVLGIKEEYWLFLWTEDLFGRENLSHIKEYTKLFGMTLIFPHVQVLQWA